MANKRHNHAVLTARAAALPTRTSLPAHLKVIQPVAGQAAIRRSRAVSMSGAARNSQGQRSEWTLSPYAPKGGWR